MGMDRKLSYIRSCDIYSMAADVIYLSIFSVSYVQGLLSFNIIAQPVFVFNELFYLNLHLLMSFLIIELILNQCISFNVAFCRRKKSN